MVEFIRIQYRLGRLTAEQVCFIAPKWITADQAEEIIHMCQANLAGKEVSYEASVRVHQRDHGHRRSQSGGAAEHRLEPGMI